MLAAGACSALGGASFDPSGPCVADGRLPGAYPELEALVPTALDGRAPDRLDSGRNCSAANLGTLADDGIEEVRFAGGLERGAERVSPSSRPTAYTAEKLGRFYEDGARESGKTSDIEVGRPTIDGRSAYRLDLVNDGRLQTIVAVDTDTAGLVRVALVSSAARDVGEEAAHDQAVTAALDALGGG